MNKQCDLKIISVIYIMLPTQLVGSRAQVWHGTALQTAYGRKGLKKKSIKKK